MATPYQLSTIALAGVLAGVSLSKEHVPQDIWQVLSTNKNTSGADVRHEAAMIGVDLAFVLVVGFVAGLSDLAGKMMIALVVALWIILLMESQGSPLSIARGTHTAARVLA